MRAPVSSAAAVILAFAAGAAQAQGVESRAPITPYKPAFEGQTRAPEQKLGVAFQATTVTQGLKFPWAIAPLPDGRLLVTEKAGALRVVGKDGALSEPLAGTPEVMSRGQGGLLDVALAPDFAKSRTIYLSYAEPNADGTNNTAVARATLGDGKLEGLTPIYRQRPGINSPAHFGSRLVWGRDGKLFVTQGDRYVGMAQAQDLGNHIGKVVRINADGSAPKDNPFVG